MQTEELVRKLQLAFDKRQKGDYVGALSDFEYLEQFSEHPRDVFSLLLFQAMCLTDLAKPGEALRILEEIKEFDLPVARKVDLRYELARVNRALGHGDEALKLAREAVDLASRFGLKEERGDGLRTLIGLLLAESGKCDEAIPILERVRADDEGWGEARVCLGDCLYKAKQYGQAIDTYKEVVSTASYVHDFYREAAVRNIGFAYYELGNYVMAVDYLSRVRDAYRDNPEMEMEVIRVLSRAESRSSQRGG